MSKIPSQRERLVSFFDSGKTLTRLTAWSELGILEAPARISELRSSNYPIVTNMITVTNRYGESVRVAEWRKQEVSGWEPVKPYDVGDHIIFNGDKCVITETSEAKLWSEKQ